ncbi:hypothetical protein CMV_016088 [Castanea mollissima]|uniref:Uncharacterized protein n=1 Tax=Castanea mollissima TaxID=60419 RepID=A0A8J4VJK6_9ROSI|nr:hypothetical protein CMV_016088 [Castanea mollissima]
MEQSPVLHEKKQLRCMLPVRRHGLAHDSCAYIILVLNSVHFTQATDRALLWVGSKPESPHVLSMVCFSENI